MNTRSTLKLLLLPVLLILCTLFYYFGELVQWAAWESLNEDFFYGIHDIHRLLFLIPIIYAGYFGRVRGAVIVTLATLAIFLPRALFVSPYPDPLFRMIFFVIIAGVIGSLTGVIRNQSEKNTRLQEEILEDRKKFLSIVDSLADGVIAICPDYTIQFMNSLMLKELGDGRGMPCYKFFYDLESPCVQGCSLFDVIDKKQITKTEYILKDKTYEVVSVPYTDIDGITCRFSIFRKTA
jgi:PAS domain-containing protein